MTTDQTDEGKISFLPLVLRLYWMLFGNGALIILGVALYSKSSLPHLIFYWLNVVLMILARYLDIHYFKGQTADLEPATPADWSLYWKIILGISTFVWLGIELAHMIIKK
jgi:hypothetical protein